MTTGAILATEPLASHHDRAAFSCGNQALDSYLKTQARQDGRRNLARVYVFSGGQATEIVGYYTLSTTSIDLGALPDDQRRKLPRYPLVPAALIGRLAVHITYQQQGIGGILLVDALKRIVQAGTEVAAYAVVVEAIDETAVSFYLKYGFHAFPSHPNRLFLPVATARKLFSQD